MALVEEFLTWTSPRTRLVPGTRLTTRLCDVVLDWVRWGVIGVAEVHNEIFWLHLFVYGNVVTKRMLFAPKKRGGVGA